ncbi:sigma-70 family RNA polymerase sigma factor [Sphingobacterium sp.]|uniref:RNA polymerase sigma factor n=1 Tax=Sphingobacterium sp. TaxID=341027 RepID=UPI0028AF4AE5|nr:sigma-70 family RNA polymerase sigma factor [Sphingobacterium sp.]
MNTPVNMSDKNLYIKYYKFINFYAFKLTGDYERAEDLTQDAFTSYLLNKSKISSNPSAIKSFLYTAVRNKLINEHRRTEISQRYWRITGFDEKDPQDIDRLVIYTELLQEIDRLVNALPNMCQQVIKLSFFEGLTNNEIKDQLNISINTVKTHKKRGLAFLQKHLNPEYFLIFINLLTSN